MSDFPLLVADFDHLDETSLCFQLSLLWAIDFKQSSSVLAKQLDLFASCIVIELQTI